MDGQTKQARDIEVGEYIQDYSGVFTLVQDVKIEGDRATILAEGMRGDGGDLMVLTDADKQVAYRPVDGVSDEEIRAAAEYRATQAALA